MPDGTKLAEFAAWCQKHITGDEKGQAQIFLDRLFQAFGQPGCLDVGGATEFRIYMIAIMAAVRRKENIQLGDVVQVKIFPEILALFPTAK